MKCISNCVRGFRVLGCAVVCSALLVSSATATILVNENFGHPNGDLVGQTPTPGPGNAWASHSGGVTNPIQVSGGEVIVNQGPGGQDANSGFANQGTSATTYARFDFRLPSASNGGISSLDGNGLYFAHFRGGSGTSFRARIGVLQPTIGDFILTVSDGANVSGGAQWATELSFDTTYRVITSYNAATEEAKLWLDPLNSSSTSISAPGGLGTADIFSYAFRQSDDYTGQQIVDNLVVATSFNEALTGIAVPEPSSVALLLCSMACLAGRRNR